KAVFGRLQMLADSIRGRGAELPAGIKRLEQGPHGGLLLLNIDGQLAISAAVPVGNPGSEQSQLATAPIVMTLRVISQRMLADIGSRLQLKNLMMIASGKKPSD